MDKQQQRWLILGTILVIKGISMAAEQSNQQKEYDQCIQLTQDNQEGWMLCDQLFEGSTKNKLSSCRE